MQFSRLIAIAALSLTTALAQPAKPKPAASPKPAAKSALDKATLETFVRHLFLWPSHVKVEVQDAKPSTVPGFLEVAFRASAGGRAQEEVFLVSKDGTKMVRGTVFDINVNPFRENLEKLNTKDAAILGTPDAPVTIVLFSDFQCPYCKTEGKMLRENLVKNYPKEVAVYFKDLPLDSIHNWARPAAVAGRCVLKQSNEKFWAFHDWAFEQQSALTAENIKAKALDWAKASGVDGVALGRCMDTKATEPEVQQSVNQAAELRITGTPTMFINGRRIARQIEWNELKQIIDFEIEHKKAADKACCEINLSGPLSGK